MDEVIEREGTMGKNAIKQRVVWRKVESPLQFFTYLKHLSYVSLTAMDSCCFNNVKWKRSAAVKTTPGRFLDVAVGN